MTHGKVRLHVDVNTRGSSSGTETSCLGTDLADVQCRWRSFGRPGKTCLQQIRIGSLTSIRRSHGELIGITDIIGSSLRASAAYTHYTMITLITTTTTMMMMIIIMTEFIAELATRAELAVFRGTCFCQKSRWISIYNIEKVAAWRSGSVVGLDQRG